MQSVLTQQYAVTNISLDYSVFAAAVVVIESSFKTATRDAVVDFDH